MRNNHLPAIFAMLFSLCLNTHGNFLFYEADGYLVTAEDEFRMGPLTGYVVVNDVPVLTEYNVSYQINDFYLDGGDLGFFRGDDGKIAYHQWDTYLVFEGYGISTEEVYDIEEMNWPLYEEIIVQKLRPSYDCTLPNIFADRPHFFFTLTCVNFPNSVPEPANAALFLIGSIGPIFGYALTFRRDKWQRL